MLFVIIQYCSALCCPPFKLLKTKYIICQEVDKPDSPSTVRLQQIHALGPGSSETRHPFIAGMHTDTCAHTRDLQTQVHHPFMRRLDRQHSSCARHRHRTTMISACLHVLNSYLPVSPCVFHVKPLRSLSFPAFASSTKCLETCTMPKYPSLASHEGSQTPKGSNTPLFESCTRKLTSWSQWQASSLQVWLKAPVMALGRARQGMIWGPPISPCLCALPQQWANELSSLNLIRIKNKTEL